MDYKNMIENLIPVVKKAGDKIIEIYNKGFEVDYKEDDTPITIADRLSNEIIVEYLKSNYPNISILSEESKQNLSRLGNEYCWIVDPLDGTKEFVKRNGEFTINIALSKKGELVLGMIYVPVKEDIYYAFKDGGSYYKSKNMKDFERIYVTDKTEKLNIAISRTHATKELENLIEKNINLINKKIVAGSSLKGCLVAKGEADIYFRFSPTMEWDVAPMDILVEEAGGIFRQLDGTKMKYNREDNLNKKGFYAINREENNFLRK